MEINNPQSFDHIIGLNGEILAPKVLLDTEIEPAKIQAEPIIWRKTTADEFHVPAAILGANGEILQPKVLSFGSIETAKISPLPIIWRKRTADEYHLPGMLVDAYDRKWYPHVETYAAFKAGSKEASPASWVNAITGDRQLPGGIIGANANALLVKVIEIGVWNMDIDAGKNVLHGLSFLKIRSVDVLIIGDEDFVVKKLNGVSDSSQDNMEGGVKNITPTQIQLTRQTAGIFDSGAFDHATMNRGFITIWYQD